MSSPGPHHAMLLSYGRAALDLSSVRPMSADVNYGSTADLTAPSPGVYDHLSLWGDFWCARTGNTARRFNVLDLSGAVKETYTKVSWGFFPRTHYANPYTWWANSRGCWYSNFGGELGLMLAQGSGTFNTLAGGDNIVGTGGIAAGNGGTSLMAIGDQTSANRLRRLDVGIGGTSIASNTIAASGDTYRFFNGAFRQNPERCYLQTGASNNNIKYYNYITSSLVDVISGVSPAFACRGVTGLRRYDDLEPARPGFDSSLWTAQNGTPVTVTQRDPSTGAITHTVSLPSGYNSVSTAAALLIDTRGKVWVHATNGSTPKVFACTVSSASPVAESPTLLNGRFPLGITANNIMAFHHTIGAQLYYSLMRC